MKDDFVFYQRKPLYLYSLADMNNPYGPQGILWPSILEQTLGIACPELTPNEPTTLKTKHGEVKIQLASFHVVRLLRKGFIEGAPDYLRKVIPITGKHEPLYCADFTPQGGDLVAYFHRNMKDELSMEWATEPRCSVMPNLDLIKQGQSVVKTQIKGHKYVKGFLYEVLHNLVRELEAYLMEANNERN